MLGVLPELREPVNLHRYAGLWYELARTRDIPFEPVGITDVQANYTWDGTTFGITNTALLPTGKPLSWTTDVTRVLNASSTRFEIVAGPQRTRGLYRILMLDPDYQWVVVAGGDDNRWIWVLAREQTLSSEQWKTLFAHLEDYYNVDLRTIEYTKHTRPPEAPPVITLPEPALMVPLGDDKFVVNIHAP